MGRRPPKPEPTLHDRAKMLTDIVHDAAARRVCQILEEVVEANIKPLEAEVVRLRGLLKQHGIEA